ncbi:aryl-sulfate sulfotransferase [Ruegeria sp. HKCCD8929]|uniref:aryl-sulfate sulfotransferase n=1 Tax=Ruegeria sp. HKCCD8929 TaxID=2683006 RepID=UPI0014876C10|nr:aryl-sulfate sulfotransferase [Ruegeria sp. HKCCD8929]
MNTQTSLSQSTLTRIMKTGVTGHNRAKAEQGYVLFSPLANLNKTFIIDMDGEVVHEWTHDSVIGIYGSLTDEGNLFMGAKIEDESWDAFGIWKAFKGGEVREVSPSGEILWRHKDIWHHHDQRKMPHGGALYMSLEQVPPDLAREVGGGHAAPDGTKEMYADVLVEVDKNGNRIWEWRAIEHLDPKVDFHRAGEPQWEWCHGNTIAPLGDDRVIVSFRAIHTVGIIDKATGEWLWKYRDPQMGGQHDPHMLENGNILVYDNGTQRDHMAVFPYSRAIEINPKTNEIEWSYKDAFPFAFYSPQISGARRLPGGNTLICEGLRGRIFQVTPKGEVVWEYVSPFFGLNVMGYDINMVFRAFFYTRDQLPFL